MAKVLEIGITKKNAQEIEKVDFIHAMAGKGLDGDRFFKNDNYKKNQLTLIEKENIDNFNRQLKISISYLNFRRNIVTQDIELNKLIGKVLLIGEAKIKVHDLCEPCRHLQDILKQKHLVKMLTHKAGIRCEILSSGKISVGDLIKF